MGSIISEMADNSATSFIPKNSTRPKKKVRSTKRIYLLSYISYVLFFGSLLATLGVLFYSVQVDRTLDQAKASLQAEQDSFRTEDISRIRNLEKKLIVAERLLNELTAPSRIFQELEKVVADNIQFSSLTYTLEPNRRSSIALTGRADNFSQILYQRDQFNRSQILESADLVSYDFVTAGPGEEEEEGPLTQERIIASLLSTQEDSLNFTFVTSVNGSLIAYDPTLSPIAVEAADSALQREDGESDSIFADGSEETADGSEEGPEVNDNLE